MGMQAIVMAEPGGAEVLSAQTVERPEPGPGQVLVAVEFAGLNFADVLARRGLPGYASRWPFVPGLEAGGTVAALGEGVDGFAVGDRVVAFTIEAGAFAEFVVADAALTARVPDELGLAAATTVPGTWASALGLVRQSYAHPGDAVLVTSASGGVGAALAAILPRHDVSVMVGGVGVRAGHPAKELADGYVAVPRDAGFLEAARDANGGRGFDVVLESVGGSLLEGVLDVMAPAGRLITYGAAAGEADPQTPAYGPLRGRNLSVGGFSILNRARNDAAAVGGLIASVFALTGKGLVIPEPRVVAWDEVIDVHVAHGEGRLSGKAVVAVGK